MKGALAVFPVFILLCSAGLFAQNPTTNAVQRLPMAKAEDVGMSSERLMRIKAGMQKYVDRREVAGVVTMIARHGKVVHLEAVGNRDAETKAPMTADTIFRIASMTKPIVSVAAMMLYEEGHFQLSDPISKWIPEFQSMRIAEVQGAGANYRTVNATNPITIRHLLTQTSGLATGDGVLAGEYQKIAPRTVPNDTVGNFVQRLAKLPLSFEPGTKWEYGQYGIATNVIGRLVEIISGKTLDEFLSERILRPLKMNDTYFYLPEAKLSRLAASYQPDANFKIQLVEAPTRESIFVREPHTFFAGNGGLVSTAADYVRFHQLMLNGGELDGVRLLGRKTVELMTSNHTGNLNNSAGPGYGFGLGYAVLRDIGESGIPGSVGLYRWGGAYGTTFFVDPVEDMIAIMMVQLRPYTHSNIRRDFQVLAYQAIVDHTKALTSSN
jgi:CubicO group peptidase (beta-lactamase class C family)